MRVRAIAMNERKKLEFLGFFTLKKPFNAALENVMYPPVPFTPFTVPVVAKNGVFAPVPAPVILPRFCCGYKHLEGGLGDAIR
jgi:hypothetical protein